MAEVYSEIVASDSPRELAQSMRPVVEQLAGRTSRIAGNTLSENRRRDID